jgi:hypothetical protein
MKRALPLALALSLAAFGCGDVNKHNPGPTTYSIQVMPADAMVTITNGQVVMEGYTATLVASDGSTPVDVTATATFTLKDTGFGNWSGPMLAVTGQGAGPTRVIATATNPTDATMQATGDTGLTVFVKGSRVVDPAPANAPDLFGAATETAGRAPALVYPADNILVPPNLGEFDVHWNDTVGNDLFETRMSNQYVDLRIYSAGTGALYTLFKPTEWYPLASSRQQLTIQVAGLVTATPTTKGTSPAQHVDVTNENAQGGIYYWTTSSPQGIYRYDIGKPSVPPAPFFPAGQEPGGSGNCMGCHALSRDGSKIALTIDSGDGRGAVYKVSDRSVLVPFASNAKYWNFATFNADGSKIVTVEHGVMQLIDANGGNVLGPVPNNAGFQATHPELSPDGTTLANVETTQVSYDFQVYNGSIVTRPFDNTTNTFGAIKTLVPDAAGASNYYPSWSPDGKWIAFTRTGGNSYDDASAKIWVVRADGSAPPVELKIANLGDNLTDSWARWVPFGQSVGIDNKPLYYLTFSTKRPFGVRIPGGGRPQIWMTPFFPDKADAGMDPTGPAFRVPFQDVNTSNHIAQWTQAIVIQ